MRSLVINARSTNVKLSVLEGERGESAARIEALGRAAAVEAGFDQLRAKGLLRVTGVGHGFVHGGSPFTQGVRITDGVAARLTELNELAPLHNPPALEAFLA